METNSSLMIVVSKWFDMTGMYQNVHSGNLQTTKNFFTSTNILVNLPFKFDPKTSKFSEISRLSRLLHSTMLLWVMIRSLYHTGWVLSNFIYGFPSIASTALEIFFVILCSTHFAFVVGINRNQTDFIPHLNEFLSTNKQLGSKFLTEETKEPDERNWKTGKKFDDGVGRYMRLLYHRA